MCSESPEIETVCTLPTAAECRQEATSAEQQHVFCQVALPTHLFAAALTSQDHGHAELIPAPLKPAPGGFSAGRELAVPTSGAMSSIFEGRATILADREGSTPRDAMTTLQDTVTAPECTVEVDTEPQETASSVSEGVAQDVDLGECALEGTEVLSGTMTLEPPASGGLAQDVARRTSEYTEVRSNEAPLEPQASGGLAKDVDCGEGSLDSFDGLSQEVKLEPLASQHFARDVLGEHIAEATNTNAPSLEVKFDAWLSGGFAQDVDVSQRALQRNEVWSDAPKLEPAVSGSLAHDVDVGQLEGQDTANPWVRYNSVGASEVFGTGACRAAVACRAAGSGWNAFEERGVSEVAALQGSQTFSESQRSLQFDDWFAEGPTAIRLHDCVRSHVLPGERHHKEAVGAPPRRRGDSHTRRQESLGRPAVRRALSHGASVRSPSLRWREKRPEERTTSPSASSRRPGRQRPVGAADDVPRARSSQSVPPREFAWQRENAQPQDAWSNHGISAWRPPEAARKEIKDPRSRNMNLRDMLSSTHVGSVCDMDEHRNIGFIRNQQIHYLTGRDVRFLFRQFRQKKCIGDLITFEIELDAGGKPWVRDTGTDGQSFYGKRSERSLTVEKMLKEEHVGTILEFHEDVGYGFVRNRDIHRLCGRDVRFQAWQVVGRCVGDEVLFKVLLNNDGLPRVAGSVSASGVHTTGGANGRAHGERDPWTLNGSRSQPWSESTSWTEPRSGAGRISSSRPRTFGYAPSNDSIAKTPVSARNVEGAACKVSETFKGTVVKVDGVHGFGLVASVAHPAREVFLARRYLVDLAPGDHVQFGVEHDTSRDRLIAVNVQKVSATTRNRYGFESKRAETRSGSDSWGWYQCPTAQSAAPSASGVDRPWRTAAEACGWWQ